MKHITSLELSQWLSDNERNSPRLIDVREAWEVALCKIEGAHHLPMRTIPEVADELPKSEPIVVYCHHGIRSMQVAAFLERQGCAEVFNLHGGINAWAAEVDPGMQAY